jgi:hypothetical protein
MAAEANKHARDTDQGVHRTLGIRKQRLTAAHVETAFHGTIPNPTKPGPSSHVTKHAPQSDGLTRTAKSRRHRHVHDEGQLSLRSTKNQTHQVGKGDPPSGTMKATTTHASTFEKQLNAQNHGTRHGEHLRAKGIGNVSSSTPSQRPQYAFWAQDLQKVVAKCQSGDVHANDLACAHHNIKAQAKSGKPLPALRRILDLLSEPSVSSITSFAPHHICMLLGAYAELKQRLPNSLLAAVRCNILSRIGEFEARNVAHATWALAKIGYKQEDIGEELLRALSRRACAIMHDFKSQDISNMLWAYATLHTIPEPELYHALSLRGSEIISEFDAQSTSNTVWACAKLGVSEDAFLDLLVRRVTDLVGNLKAQHVANIMWSFGTFTMRRKLDKEVLNLLLRRACQVVHDLKSQEVANIFWVCGTLRIQPDAETFSLLCSRGCQVAGYFRSQAVSNSLWCFATLDRHPGAEFLGLLCNHTCKIIADFDSQNIANTLWALARLDRQKKTVQKDLFDLLIQQACAISAQCKAQEVTNVLWACATLELDPGKDAFQVLCGRAELVMKTGTAQTLSNFLWACATLGQNPGKAVLAQISVRGCEQIAYFNSQAVANVLWSYACLGEMPEKGFLDLLISQGCQVIARSGNGQEISNALWAMATLRIEPGSETLKLLCRRSCEIIGDFQLQAVTNALWACAVLHALPEGLQIFHAAHAQISSIMCVPGGKDMNMLQLQQFLLSVDLEIESARCHHDGPAHERYMLFRKGIDGINMQKFVSFEPHVSLLQKDVAAAVNRLELPYVEEAVDAQSGYTIDVLVDGKIAIEVDGPSHFLFDCRTPKGATVLKRRHLQLLGYKVVSVPYWDWNLLCGENGDQKQEEYIRRLITA